MKKIKSLYKRNYYGDRLVYDEIVEGTEWVIEGEGIATEKIDGTCCMVRDRILFKRYDRKMKRKYYKRLKKDRNFIPSIKHFKVQPEGWEPAEIKPNMITGHWPGWLPVRDIPEDQWHNEAFKIWAHGDLPNGTYELIGPKIQGNPYCNQTHRLIAHDHHVFLEQDQPPRDFEELRIWLKKTRIEGVVWHHPDGRMVKIKRSDFGFPWP